MSGRRGYRQDRPQTPEEAEAICTATIIAGLRSRLRDQIMLEHPKVLSELQKLEEQIAAQLEPSAPNPGRHRSRAEGAISRQIADAAGFDLQPDPLATSTPAQFMEALRRYRAWSGNPSWRKMAKRAAQAVVHSTMHTAMKGDALPKFDVMKAIIVGCGGGPDDLQAFATAWRRIANGGPPGPAPDTIFFSAPVPTLQLAPFGGHS